VTIDLRKPTPEDLERFRECLAADPDHIGQDADEWIKGELITFFDEQGNRVWVKVEPVLRLSIQHDQAAPKEALREIIYKGFAWLQGAARQKGCAEVIFESTAKPLIAFCRRRFGFAQRKNDYSTRGGTSCAAQATLSSN
jgi:hypothetical protein